MATAVIAIAGSLLGVVLGSALSFLAQNARLRAKEPGVEETGVRKADQARRDLIKLFKADLDIPPDVADGDTAGQAGAATGQPGTDQRR